MHFQWLTRAAARRAPAAARAPDRPHRPRRPAARAARRASCGAQRRLYERVDAVVVHSEHGARAADRRARARPRARHVIPHGAFDHLTRLPDGAAAARAARRGRPARSSLLLRPAAPVQGPRRPARGVARASADAELWVVGMPRMPLRRCAPRRPACASCPRFVTDAEPGRRSARADLVVLPYREIDQSGVLFTALAFGRRCCSPASAASPRSPRPAPPSWSRPATRPRCTPRCARCSTTRTGARRWAPRRGASGRDHVRLGRRSRARHLELYAQLVGDNPRP